MNTPPEDDKPLIGLIRDARPAPSLPPRFQEGVWRRIELADFRGALSSVSWLDSLVAWITQPRRVLVGATALVLVGITIGVVQGGSMAHDIARARYLSAVTPVETR